MGLRRVKLKRVVANQRSSGSVCLELLVFLACFEGKPAGDKNKIHLVWASPSLAHVHISLLGLIQCFWSDASK